MPGVTRVSEAAAAASVLEKLDDGFLVGACARRGSHHREKRSIIRHPTLPSRVGARASVHVRHVHVHNAVNLVPQCRQRRGPEHQKLLAHKRRRPGEVHDHLVHELICRHPSRRRRRRRRRYRPRRPRGSARLFRQPVGLFPHIRHLLLHPRPPPLDVRPLLFLLLLHLLTLLALGGPSQPLADAPAHPRRKLPLARLLLPELRNGILHLALHLRLDGDGTLVLRPKRLAAQRIEQLVLGLEFVAVHAQKLTSLQRVANNSRVVQRTLGSLLQRRIGPLDPLDLNQSSRISARPGGGQVRHVRDVPTRDADGGSTCTRGAIVVVVVGARGVRRHV